MVDVAVDVAVDVLVPWLLPLLHPAARMQMPATASAAISISWRMRSSPIPAVTPNRSARRATELGCDERIFASRKPRIVLFPFASVSGLVAARFGQRCHADGLAALGAGAPWAIAANATPMTPLQSLRVREKT